MKIYLCGIRCVLIITIIVFAMLFQSTLLNAGIYPEDVAFDNVKSHQKLAVFLENLYQETLDNGIAGFTPYSLLLIKEAKDALKKKKYEKAELLAEYAEKLSPHLPQSKHTKAVVQWNKNKILIQRLITGYIKSFLEKVQNLEAFSFMLFTNLASIICAFLLSVVVFAVISMTKYFSLMFHDLRHVIARTVPDKALWCMILMVFLFPGFLGFSIILVCFYWLLLLFSYHSKAGRFVIIGALFVLALMPFSISATSLSLYVPQNELIKLLWEANYGYIAQKDLEGLEKYNIKHPSDEAVLFSLGLMHKKEKNYTTARRYYEKLIDINPGCYKTYTNTGNVCLAINKWEEAVEKYKTAISIEPELSAAAHFNLARAYQQRFMFSDAEKELSEAKKIDSSRINNYLRLYSENYNRLLIDEVISKRRLWVKGYSFFKKDDELANEFWNIFFRPIPFRYASVIIFCILFFVIILAGKDKLRVAVKCKTCGKSICKRCQWNTSGDIICYQCLNLLKQQAGSDYRLKENHKEKVNIHSRNNNYTGAVLSLLFPGAGHIWKGQSIKGVIYLFLFSVFLLKVIFYFLLKEIFSISCGGLEAVFLLVMLTFICLLSAIDSFQIRDKTLEDNLYLMNK